MIHTGDCVEVMSQMEPESVDAIVTDPPYGINFMGKAWDGANIDKAIGEYRRTWETRDKAPRKDNGRAHSTPIGSAAASAGVYDLSPKAMLQFQAWCTEWAREAFRVLKSGGHLLAFGGTRTSHRLASAIEDAGFEIRDTLTWIYASGFPKSHNLTGEWDGWGTALKPAWEPIVMARKPLQGTVAQNVLRHGTGALNIAASRIGTTREVPASHSKTAPTIGATGFADRRVPSELNPNIGRWPSNLLLSDPELFDEPNPWVVGSGATSEAPGGPGRQGNYPPGVFGGSVQGPLYFDSGGYSRFFRFFLIPKADRADREPVLRGQLAAQGYASGAAHKRCAKCGRQEVNVNGSECKCDEPEWIRPEAARTRSNVHPTVKPVDLMRHLVRLVTPPGGIVLDPFLGSGSTAIACELEGFPWIGIEKDESYVAIAEARLNGTQRGLGLDFGPRGEPAA
jgi:DNA modification methylase